MEHGDGCMRERAWADIDMSMTMGMAMGGTAQVCGHACVRAGAPRAGPGGLRFRVRPHRTAAGVCMAAHPPSLPLLLHGVRLFRLCAQRASVRPKKLLLQWWEAPSEEPWWCGRMDIDTQS
jgi:hypothetical protein